MCGVCQLLIAQCFCPLSSDMYTFPSRCVLQMPWSTRAYVICSSVGRVSTSGLLRLCRAHHFVLAVVLCLCTSIKQHMHISIKRPRSDHRGHTFSRCPPYTSWRQPSTPVERCRWTFMQTVVSCLQDIQNCDSLRLVSGRKPICCTKAYVVHSPQHATQRPPPLDCELHSLW